VAGFLVLQISAFIVYLALLALTNTRKISEVSKILDSQANNAVSSSPTPFTISNGTISDEEDSFGGSGSGSGSGDNQILSNGEDIVEITSSIPLVTVLQVISLVLGVIATFVYVASAVSYVRSVSSSSHR